ncbi:MAG TPA: hypothetical protein VGX78_06145, partial [Pirellulales bacterium]|nr:hypothetical protein [Pirellulales bacterium]
AHFASFDGPLMSCWLLAWATFVPALGRASWSVVWGAALGMTMSCKLTGWFAPLPFVFWVAAFGDRKAARALALGIFVALATFWVLNPPLWHSPLDGLATFFDMNLGRAERPGLNIPTMYFGQRYDAQTPLPWHNTLVWTAITVPAGTLALFIVGVGHALKRWRTRPEWLLLVGHWAVLVVVRATPWAPPHDAERLFLPSFAFLALLAGLGADVLWRRGKGAEILSGANVKDGREATEDLRHSVPQLQVAEFARIWATGEGGRPELLRVQLRARIRAAAITQPPELWRAQLRAACRRWRWPELLRVQLRNACWRSIGRAAVLLALAGSAASTVWYAPQWLSYYNLVIGGLRGADASGMEAAYYWDGLDSEVLAWLHDHSNPDEKIEFAPLSWENLRLMREWGTLRRGCFPDEPGRCRWYVIQRRPGFWSPADRRLVEHGRPAFGKTIRSPSAGWGTWRLDVPLIEVFDYDDYRRAQEQNKAAERGAGAPSPLAPG